MVHLSVRTKIILITLSILVITFVLNALVNGYAFANLYTRGLRDVSLFAAHDLKLQLDRLFELDMSLEGIVGFEKQAQKVTTEFEDVTYAFVMDREGRILFHSQTDKQGQRVSGLPPSALFNGTDAPVTETHTSDGMEVLETTLPLYDKYNQMIGAISVGASTSKVTQQTMHLLMTFAGVNLVFLVTATGLLMLALRVWVTRPLAQLVSVIQHIRTSADLTQQVAVISHDEFGQLGTAFNGMLKELQASLLQNEHYAHDLEQKSAGLERLNAQLAQEIADREHAEAERAFLQQQIIEAQQAAIRELSTPLIPLSQHVVLMPLIGSIDRTRAQQIMETLLNGISMHRATTVIIDITGVQVVDTQIANAFLQTAQAVKLLGAQVVLTGIGPTIAHTLVELGAKLDGLVTHGSLQNGIAYAMSRGGTKRT